MNSPPPPKIDHTLSEDVIPSPPKLSYVNFHPLEVSISSISPVFRQVKVKTYAAVELENEEKGGLGYQFILKGFNYIPLDIRFKSVQN